MRRVLFTAILLAAFVGFTACSNQGGVPSSEEGPKEETGSTQIAPEVEVEDQEVADTVLVQKVTSPEAGFMTIHIQGYDDKPGEVIGKEPVQTGDNANVQVSLDMNKITTVLYAMLHYDRGQIGVYEFPGPDVPILINDNTLAMKDFKSSLMTPSVNANDQEIKNGSILINKVVATEAGFLVIHTVDSKGDPADNIGQTPVKKGAQGDVIVTINSDKATDTLFAMLHYDRGVIGTYEFPGSDVPVMDGNKIVNVSFKVIKPSPVESEPVKTEEKKSEPIKKEEPTASAPAPQTKSFSIIAKQYTFEPAVITVNKGDQVRLTIKSVDVPHGFSISDFNVNVNLEKDQTKTVEFKADKTGTFTFFCSVYCGTGHNEMKGSLVVK